ncbi:WhiB family transcriptional regulator [Streptomyces sp. NPDC005395]|uniref:WhiB family transcriptional regulator n=1 Tax=unclassified Streptomyces TaxID=2593676 RepID=UPI001F37AFA5|nr:WhiB family transcriptional regulator [Streptomyces sp. BSE6.1]
MPRPSHYTPDVLPPPRHWAADAACRDEDTAVFFPKDFRRSEVPLITEQAKTVCRRCPVREACLEAALARPEWHGVWGGLDEDERRVMRRREQRRALRRAARLKK